MIGLPVYWRGFGYFTDALTTNRTYFCRGNRESPEIVSLHKVRRDLLVVDDESITDSEPFELCLRQRNQLSHLAAVNGGRADDFGDQLRHFDRALVCQVVPVVDTDVSRQHIGCDEA